MQFGEAVARALLIGVEIGGLDGVRIGSGSKMGRGSSSRKDTVEISLHR